MIYLQLWAIARPWAFEVCKLFSENAFFLHVILLQMMYFDCKMQNHFSYQKDAP